MKLHGSKLLKERSIRHLMGRRLNAVWFPEVLEKDYRFQYKNAIAQELRYRGIVLFLLYWFLCYGIYSTSFINHFLLNSRLKIAAIKLKRKPSLERLFL